MEPKNENVQKSYQNSTEGQNLKDVLSIHVNSMINSRPLFFVLLEYVAIHNFT